MRQVGIVIALLFFFWLNLPAAQAQQEAILVLQIEGPVTPAMANYFERGIQAAEREGATAVLVILNTPGGNLEPTQNIVRSFLQANVPVIVYVGPRGAQAASAGSIITMAAHAAAMAPGTVIGAASPVGEGGVDLGETLLRKVTEDLKAQVRGLTERRGPEAVALAEAMIEEARAVNAGEALAVGLIDVVADDVPDLLAQLDGFTVTVNDQPVALQTAAAQQRAFPMSFIEQVLYALSNPLLVSILLVIGVQAILIEISNPGGWVAGFIGIMCLGLAFYGLGQLPVNWLGLGLIVVAFVLFVMEATTTTNGALAITGTLTLLAGLLVLFNSPGTPEFARISISGAILISLSTAALFVFLVTKALRAQKRPPVTGVEGLVGHRGTVRTEFSANPDKTVYNGMVLVMGELWRAEAGEPINKDEEVVVTGVQGFTVRVRRAKAT